MRSDRVDGKWRRFLFWGGLLALSLAGCAGSRLVAGHPELRPASDQLAARVYLIRPRTERSLGAADNEILIEADRHPLLRMSKGEYTLVNFQPGRIDFKVTSATTWGPRQAFKVWSRTASFTFAPQQTYYLALTAVDGEFRGVFFKPELVDEERAAELVVGARAFGQARLRPIVPVP